MFLFHKSKMSYYFIYSFAFLLYFRKWFSNNKPVTLRYIRECLHSHKAFLKLFVNDFLPKCFPLFDKICPISKPSKEHMFIQHEMPSEEFPLWHLVWIKQSAHTRKSKLYSTVMKLHSNGFINRCFIDSFRNKCVIFLWKHILLWQQLLFLQFLVIVVLLFLLLNLLLFVN